MMTKAYRPHGTLLLAVIYREGVILAGDKGGHGGVLLNDEVDLTEQVKVVCVNQKIVMAATGHAIIANPDNHSEQRVNCFTSGNDYFRENTFTNTDEFWNGLTQAIAQPYKDYIERSGDTDRLSLELPIIYDFDGLLRLREVKLQSDGSQVTSGITPQHWFRGFFGYWGYAQVAEGLVLKKSRFSALARHASIRPFLDMSTSPQTLSLQKARIFVRKIMEVSSNLEPSKGNVSPEFNDVVIEGRYMFAPIPEE
jgi:hypothetical protein